MDYLQYLNRTCIKFFLFKSFKPYYKWITFNTYLENKLDKEFYKPIVLNLIINGLPSIHRKY